MLNDMSLVVNPNDVISAYIGLDTYGSNMLVHSTDVTTGQTTGDFYRPTYNCVNNDQAS
jgi:hypothetical protein